MVLEMPKDISEIEFLVGFGNPRQPKLFFVKAELDVRAHLNSAVHNTHNALLSVSQVAATYDPSNVYETYSHLQMSISHPFAETAVHLLKYENAEPLSNPVDSLSKISFYCARYISRSGIRTLAVRRTSQFAKRLQREGRVFWSNSGLSLVTEPEFQLQDDFDFIIDETEIAVLRHGPFESTLGLGRLIKASVEHSVKQFQVAAPFIKFDAVIQHATTNLRSARLIASIKNNGYLDGLTESSILGHLDRREISYEIIDNQIVIDEQHCQLFLRLVARQVLGVELVPGQDEQFLATSRSKL